jgi:hypothetical protein
MDGRRPGLILFIIAVLVVSVLVAVIILFPPKGNGDSNQDDDQGTGPWKDLTKLKASLSEVTTFNLDSISNPQSLDDELDPGDTIYFLIGIQQNLSSEDIVAIKDFTERGGKVVLADDGDSSNRLSDFMQGTSGGKVEFTDRNYLVDAGFGDDPSTDPGWIHNIRFIKGYSLVEGEQRPHEVLIDKPKGLVITGDGQPILTTTKQLTVIDMNDNGEMDLEEENKDLYSPYGPIGVEFSAGDNGGSVTYFSSTGHLTDSMFSELENEDFIRSYLLTLIPNGGDILLDSSKQLTDYSPHTAVIPG